MIADIIKGFLIGICASIPVGPIAILVIQKSLSKGRNAGFVTGLGSAFVDTVYAIVAIFALAFVQNFIADHRPWILLSGGLIVAMLGVSMLFSNPFRKLHRREAKADQISPKDFLKAILMGLSNPGAILVMFALFAFFKVDLTQDWNVAPIILSVASGAALYWFLFADGVSHFRKNIDMKHLIWVNRITGAIVIIIGVALAAEGGFILIFK